MRAAIRKVPILPPLSVCTPEYEQGRIERRGHGTLSQLTFYCY